MYIQIETQTERFFLEAYSCRDLPIIPPQEGEPTSTKTRTLQVDCIDGEQLNYDLEPGDWVYIMNNSGKTINKFGI